MQEITGYVSYGVHVNCPHCEGLLDLTEPPYEDEGLGLALFGTTTSPAKWDNLDLDFICNHCKKQFVLRRLEL